MGGASESSALLGPPGGPPVHPAWAPQLLAALCGGLIAMVVGSTVSLPSALIPQLVKDGLARDLEEASVLATAYLYTAVPACPVRYNGGTTGDTFPPGNQISGGEVSAFVPPLYRTAPAWPAGSSATG